MWSECYTVYPNFPLSAIFNEKPPASVSTNRGFIIDQTIRLSNHPTYLSLAVAFPFSSITAWAAASRATGMRLGEQDT